MNIDDKIKAKETVLVKLHEILPDGTAKVEVIEEVKVEIEQLKEKAAAQTTAINNQINQ